MIKVIGVNLKGNNINNNKLSLAPYELIPYFLGLYKSVIELRKDLVNLNIIDIPYNSDLPLTDLHWMISDGKECIVVEQTYDGLKIYDNPVGVLTNNPQFSYHLTNINNYITQYGLFSIRRSRNFLDLSLCCASCFGMRRLC